MRQQLSIRLLAVTAIAGSATLAVLVPGGSAFAGKPKPTKVTCTAISGSESSVTLSGCSDPAVTGGGGTSNVSTSTVTWNTTGLTSTENYTVKVGTGKKDKCTAPPGFTNTAEVKEKGSVSGGTATTLTGGKVSATVCVFTETADPSVTSVALLPGTVLSI
jgi:hypothetical protein